jgi:hypothetical protein
MTDAECEEAKEECEKWRGKGARKAGPAEAAAEVEDEAGPKAAEDATEPADDDESDNANDVEDGTDTLPTEFPSTPVAANEAVNVDADTDNAASTHTPVQRRRLLRVPDVRAWLSTTEAPKKTMSRYANKSKLALLCDKAAAAAQDADEDNVQERTRARAFLASTQENGEKHARLLFSTFPSRQEYHVPEQRMNHIVRRRLLLESPLDAMGVLTKPCNCAIAERPLSWHVGTCATGHATTIAHDVILGEIVREFKRAGATVARKCNHREFAGEGKVPDAFVVYKLMDEPEKEVYLDVTVLRTHAEGMEKQLAEDTLKRREEGTEDDKEGLIDKELKKKEALKEKKYMHEARRANCEIWGIALSSGGRLGQQFTNLTKIVARLAGETTEADVPKYLAALNQRLSFAIHKADYFAYQAALGAFHKQTPGTRTRKEMEELEELLSAPHEDVPPRPSETGGDDRE